MNAQKMFKEAKKFNLSPVKERYGKEQELPNEVVDEHFDELLKYLCLCAVSGQGYGMRGPVDECWHTFIIFTKEYADFCDKVLGRFIHHAPNTNKTEKLIYSINASKTSDANDQPIVGRIREAYQKFLEDYKTTFKTAAPAYLWPIPMKLEYGPGDDCNCGDCLCGCYA
jgi:hypothetical protein